MADIGYIRVSTAEQNTDRQHQAMEGLSLEKVFEEKVSGVKNDREELNNMMNYVREGDNIYCYEISRLARSCTNLLDIINGCDKKGVTITFIKENLTTGKNDAFSSFFLIVLAALSQLERDLIRERSTEGIKLAKMEGRYTGRKPLSIENFGLHYDKYMRREYKSKTEFAKEVECSRPTLDKLIQSYLKNLEQGIDSSEPLVTLPKETTV